MQGAAGAGKGVFGNHVGDLFGPDHFVHFGNMKNFLSPFNGWQRKAMFVFVDECVGKRTQGGQAQIKAMLTEPETVVNEKQQAMAMCQQRANFVIATNDDWAVAADHDSRRYAMTKVATSRCGDKAYWTALVAQWQNGGREAFFDMLLRHPLPPGWTAEDAVSPRSKRLLFEQKMYSAPPFERWIVHVVRQGDFVQRPTTVSYRDSWSTALLFPHERLYAYFDEWRRETRVVGKLGSDDGSSSLPAALHKLIGAEIHGGSIRLPSLADCRTLLAGYFCVPESTLLRETFE
ncbi:DNA primase [uncultured virus]|nr:DNA primase [uncultured virus]